MSPFVLDDDLAPSDDDQHQVSDGAESSMPPSPPSPGSPAVAAARLPVVRNVVHISVHATTANVTVNSGQPDHTPRSTPSTPTCARAARLESLPATPTRPRTAVTESVSTCTPHRVPSEDWDADTDASPATPCPQSVWASSDAGDEPDQVPSPRIRTRQGLRSPDGLAERDRLIREALELVRIGRPPRVPAASSVPVHSSSSALSSPPVTQPPVQSTAVPSYTEVDLLKEYIAAPDPRYRGKWYVVTAGTRVGVFKTYAEVQRYTSGISRSSQQSTQSRREAVDMYSDFKARGLVDVLSE